MRGTRRVFISLRTVGSQLVGHSRRKIKAAAENEAEWKQVVSEIYSDGNEQLAVESLGA